MLQAIPVEHSELKGVTVTVKMQDTVHSVDSYAHKIFHNTVRIIILAPNTGQKYH